MSEAIGQSQTCRACLEPSTKTYPLVGNILNVDVNIASMLEYCTSIKLDLNDNLPQSVCLACFKSTRLAYHFLKQFQECQEKLYEILNTPQQEYEDTKEGIDLKGQCNSATASENSKLEDFDCDLSEIYSVKSVTDERTDNEETYKDEQNNCSEESKVDSDYFLQYDYENPNDEINELTSLTSAGVELFEFVYVKDESVASPENNSSCNQLMKKSGNQRLKATVPAREPVKKTLVPLERDQCTSVVYKCPLCTRKFRRFNLFYKHVYSHEKKTIACARCPYNVELDIEEFFDHYKEVHKYQCDICHKCLSSSYGYQYHMKQHEDIKKYKCPLEGCGKSFLLSNLLKKHLSLHKKHCDHHCDLCSASFRSIGALRYHKKTHDGNRTHLCTYCGRAFYQAVHLRDHMYRHYGYKKFICEICGKSFTTNSQLTKHNRFCLKKNKLNSTYIYFLMIY